MVSPRPTCALGQFPSRCADGCVIPDDDCTFVLPQAFVPSTSSLAKLLPLSNVHVHRCSATLVDLAAAERRLHLAVDPLDGVTLEPARHDALAIELRLSAGDNTWSRRARRQRAQAAFVRRPYVTSMDSDESPSCAAAESDVLEARLTLRRPAPGGGGEQPEPRMTMTIEWTRGYGRRRADWKGLSEYLRSRMEVGDA